MHLLRRFGRSSLLQQGCVRLRCRHPEGCCDGPTHRAPHPGDRHTEHHILETDTPSTTSRRPTHRAPHPGDRHTEHHIPETDTPGTTSRRPTHRASDQRIEHHILGLVDGPKARSNHRDNHTVCYRQITYR